MASHENMVNLVTEVLTKPNELCTFIKFYMIYKTENTSKLEDIYNLLTSFVYGELKDNATHNFYEQYCEILYRELENDVKKIPLLNMINDWLDNQQNSALDHNILKNIIQMRSKFKRIDYLKVQKFIKFTWSIKGFRNTIFMWPQYKFGLDYENKYLFSNNSLEEIKYLIEDKSIHEDLLNYLSKILECNKYYRSSDSTLILSNPCNSYDFLSYIMNILFKMLNMHNYNNNFNEIVYDVILETKETESIITKLYIILYDAIWYGYILPIEKKRVFFEFETCLTIKNFFSTFHTVYKANKLTENEILTFIDYVNMCVILIEKNPSYPFDMKVFESISDIIGNDKNVHTRSTTVGSVFLCIRIVGYEAFGQFFFSNLFKFFCEVNIYGINSLVSAIALHKNIITEFIMLLDHGHTCTHTNIFNEQPKEIIAKILFNLESRALDLFSHFQNLCRQVQNNRMMLYDLTIFEVIGVSLNIFNKTFMFHSTIYDKKIITELFPEVEDKYSILISELLKFASNRYLHDIFSVPETFSEMNKVVNSIYNSIYDSILKHIEHSVEYLVNYKDIIIKSINLSDLHDPQKNYIISKLEKYHESEIDYPSDFLDPITCKIIKNPIKIPNVSLFFDRSAILTHIYEKGDNPYTREKLSIDELNEYNKQKDIVDEILVFKQLKKEFEEKNAKK
jgi:hypothetical protein